MKDIDMNSELRRGDVVIAIGKSVYPSSWEQFCEHNPLRVAVVDDVFPNQGVVYVRAKNGNIKDYIYNFIKSDLIKIDG